MSQLGLYQTNETPVANDRFKQKLAELMRISDGTDWGSGGVILGRG